MQEQLYKIGAVAQRTGLSVERLRAWERRHGLEPAHKANRTRYYNQAQVSKLLLIRELIEHGHSISDLVDLTAKELKRILDGTELSGPTENFRLILAGEVTPYPKEIDSWDECEVVLHLHSLDEFESRLDELPQAEVVVVGANSLDVERLEELNTVVQQPMYVVYRYASKKDLDMATEVNLQVFRFGETHWKELIARIDEDLLKVRSQELLVRSFSEEELRHLSRTQSESIIEPRDLVDIIRSQRALVDHIQRNTQRAFDVELAGLIQLSESKMEEALQQLAGEFELIVE